MLVYSPNNSISVISVIVGLVSNRDSTNLIASIIHIVRISGHTMNAFLLEFFDAFGVLVLITSAKAFFLIIRTLNFLAIS